MICIKKKYYSFIQKATKVVKIDVDLKQDIVCMIKKMYGLKVICTIIYKDCNTKTLTNTMVI